MDNQAARDISDTAGHLQAPAGHLPAPADHLPAPAHHLPVVAGHLTGPFRLGGKLVHPDANSIDGHRVDAKTIDVLLTLVCAAPRPVPPAELMDKVWPNVVVGDNVIHQAVTNIRKALKDDAKQPLFVETVPRKGYRLIAEVEWPEQPAAAAVPSRTRHSRGAAFAVIAFLMLAASSILGAAYMALPAAPVDAGELKLTVMPFAHVAADDQHHYVSQSIYDEIVANLGRADRITLVGSRTSLSQPTEENLSSTLERLGTTHVLEGSTRIIDGTTVRINLRLFDATMETHLWGGTYELDASGNFQQALADRVGVAVLAAMEGGESDDIDTYQTFTRLW